MDSHVFRKAAARLPALADIAVLRFNLRGVSSARGTSQGDVRRGRGRAVRRGGGDRVRRVPRAGRPWLLGWSFGTDLVLRYGCDPGVEGAILLSPPLRSATDGDLDVWAASGKPMLVLVPEFDDYLRPAEARRRFARVPQARVVGVDGARHLWVGEPYVRRALDEIVEQVRPGHGPLPRRTEVRRR